MRATASTTKLRAGEAKGVKSSGLKVTYYKMKQLTVTDPDGYQLCFQQPV
jgi:hypothetical protein